MFALALAAAITVAALAAGAGGAALDRSGGGVARRPPGEYTPASRPAPGGSRPCPRGFRAGAYGGRCYAACASTHEQLLTFPRRGRIGVRCVPTRITRLYYGLELRATYRHEQSGPGLDTIVETHSWRFRPNVEAVVLFRQCSTLLVDETGNEINPQDLLRRKLTVSPRISCKRQERALRATFPAVRVHEDVSFRTNGTVVGGGYTFTRTAGTTAETAWYENGQLRKAPCFNVASEQTIGSGPLSVPTQLRTQDRAAGFRGLELAITGEGRPGTAVHTTSGVACPPVPKGADLHRLHADPSTPPIPPEAVAVRDALGAGAAASFYPKVGDRFGARKIDVTDVVKADRLDDPNAKDATVVDFTLVLTRCARQAPPSGCGA